MDETLATENPAPASEQKGHLWIIVVLIIISLVVLSVVGIGILLANNDPLVEDIPIEPFEVTDLIQTEEKTAAEPDTGGMDLAVTDFITNTDVISYDSYISFIPIIRNMGNQPSGPFQVVYYLNGKYSSSFELQNLEPGEIVNNFIAGTGFGGNFGVSGDQEMELKLMLIPREKTDVNHENNQVIWKFHYTTKTLPKHTCTYSDNNQGPEDFKTKTAIRYDDKILTDFCADDKYLMEYLCDLHPVYEGDASIEVFLYKCPGGCADGKCN